MTSRPLNNCMCPGSGEVALQTNSAGIGMKWPCCTRHETMDVTVVNHPHTPYIRNPVLSLLSTIENRGAMVWKNELWDMAMPVRWTAFRVLGLD